MVSKVDMAEDSRISPEHHDQLVDKALNTYVEGRNPATTFLARCFRAGVPLRHALDETQARYATTAWDTPPAQHALLHDTLHLPPRLHPVIPDFSFGMSRCKRFIRLLLDEIDHCAGDIDEHLAVHAAHLCASADPDTSATMRWIVLCASDARHPPIVLRVAPDISRLALSVWEAGFMLHSQITLPASRLRADVTDKRVLELGAGTALSASALRHARVQMAYLTDLPRADVMANLQCNVVSNCAAHVVHTAPLDLSDVTRARLCAEQWRVQTVLAADLSYDVSLIEQVVDALAVLLDGSQRVAYLFATRRTDLTEHALMAALMAQEFLHIENVPLSVADISFEYLIHFDFSSIYAFRLTWKKKADA